MNEKRREIQLKPPGVLIIEGIVEILMNDNVTYLFIFKYSVGLELIFVLFLQLPKSFLSSFSSV